MRTGWVVWVLVGLVVAIALAVATSYANLDLKKFGVRSLAREGAAQRLADEAKSRAARRETDLKYLGEQLDALRSAEETLADFRSLKGPDWAREIRAAYVNRPCRFYSRWETADDLRDYFKKRPELQLVAVEDLKTTRPDIERLWQEAGRAALKQLISALHTPRVVASCNIDNPVQLSEEIINILVKLNLEPKDFGTTPGKLAALVRAAR